MSVKGRFRDPAARFFEKVVTDIDTAEIRAHWGLPKDTAAQSVQMIDILCDALDAARAELNDAKCSLVYARKHAGVNQVRAEAAEDALSVTAMQRDRAEARIAAAMELCDQDPNGEPIWQLDDIRRALTGDES